jgi:hypothetical protein
LAGYEWEQRQRHTHGEEGGVRETSAGLVTAEGRIAEGRGVRIEGRGPEGGRGIMAEMEGEVFHRVWGLVIADY